MGLVMFEKAKWNSCFLIMEKLESNAIHGFLITLLPSKKCGLGVLCTCPNTVSNGGTHRERDTKTDGGISITFPPKKRRD